VQTPEIVSITSSPVLLQDGDTTTLNCTAVGGPRLTLAWQRGGMDIVNGMMGDGMVTRTIMSASNNDLGNYTCHATIDSEQMESSILVVGKICMYCQAYSEIFILFCMVQMLTIEIGAIVFNSRY